MTWDDVATALLGSWPASVGAWRPEVLAAYIRQLEARGLTPDSAYAAILSWDGGDQIVPPTASQLATEAHRDPMRPTPDEMVEQIYGRGGLLGFSRGSATIHPLVHAFAQRKGLDWLQMLPINGDNGHLILGDLKRDFEVFVEENEHRGRAALAAGERRGQLSRLGNPLRVLPAIPDQHQPPEVSQ